MENREEKPPKWFSDSRKCPKVISLCPMEQCPFKPLKILHCHFFKKTLHAKPGCVRWVHMHSSINFSGSTLSLGVCIEHTSTLQLAWRTTRCLQMFFQVGFSHWARTSTKQVVSVLQHHPVHYCCTKALQNKAKTIKFTNINFLKLKIQKNLNSYLFGSNGALKREKKKDNCYVI